MSLGEKPERRAGCDGGGNFEENCARKLWLAPGVALAKRTGLAVAANPEKSTLARSDFIILQLNKTNFWHKRVNKVWEKTC